MALPLLAVMALVAVTVLADMRIIRRFQNSVTVEVTQSVATLDAALRGTRETISFPGVGQGEAVEIAVPGGMATYNGQRIGYIPELAWVSAANAIVENEFGFVVGQQNVASTFVALGYLSQDEADGILSAPAQKTAFDGSGTPNGDTSTLDFFLAARRRLLAIAETCQQNIDLCGLQTATVSADQNTAIKTLTDLQNEMIQVRAQAVDQETANTLLGQVVSRLQANAAILDTDTTLSNTQVRAITASIRLLNDTVTALTQARDSIVSEASTLVQTAQTRIKGVYSALDVATAELEASTAFSINEKYRLSQTLTTIRELTVTFDREVTFVLQRSIAAAKSLMSVKHILAARRDQEYMALTASAQKVISGMLAGGFVPYFHNLGSGPSLLPFAERNHVVSRFMIFDPLGRWRFTWSINCDFQRLAFSAPLSVSDILGFRTYMATCGTPAGNATGSGDLSGSDQSLADWQIPCTCYSFSWNQTVARSQDRAAIRAWLQDPNPVLAANQRFLEPVNATVPVGSVYSAAPTASRKRYLGQNEFCGVFQTLCESSDNGTEPLYLVYNDRRRFRVSGQALSGRSCSCDPQDALTYALQSPEDGLSIPFRVLLYATSALQEMQTEMQRIKQLCMGELPDPLDVESQRETLQRGSATQLTGIDDTSNVPFTATTRDQAVISGFSPSTLPVIRYYSRRLSRDVRISGGSLANSSRIVSSQWFNDPLESLPLTWKWAGYPDCITKRCAIQVTGLDASTGFITATSGAPTMTFTYDTEIDDSPYFDALDTSPTMLQRRNRPTLVLCKTDFSNSSSEPDGIARRAPLCDIDVLEGATREQFQSKYVANGGMAPYMVAVRNRTRSSPPTALELASGFLDLECAGLQTAFDGVCRRIFDEYFIRLNRVTRTLDLISRRRTAIARVTIQVASRNASSPEVFAIERLSVAAVSEVPEGCPSSTECFSKEMDAVRVSVTDTTTDAPNIRLRVSVSGRNPACAPFATNITGLVRGTTTDMDIPNCEFVHTTSTRVLVHSTVTGNLCREWEGGLAAATASSIARSDINSRQTNRIVAIPGDIVGSRVVVRDQVLAMLNQVSTDSQTILDMFSDDVVGTRIQALFNARRASDVAAQQAQLRQLAQTIRDFANRAVTANAEALDRNAAAIISKFTQFSELVQRYRQLSDALLAQSLQNAADEQVTIDSLQTSIRDLDSVMQGIADYLVGINRSNVALAVLFIQSAPASINFTSNATRYVFRLIGKGLFNPTVNFVAPQSETDQMAAWNAAKFYPTCDSSNLFCGEWSGAGALVIAASVAILVVIIRAVLVRRGASSPP